MGSDTTRFQIGGKTYRAKSLDEISLDDVIVFDSMAAEAGYGDLKFDDVQALMDRLEADPKAELSARESAILTAVTVWLMRRAAGEDITLKEAARVPLTGIKPLPSTGDKQGPKAKKKAAKKSRPSSPPAATSGSDPSEP